MELTEATPPQAPPPVSIAEHAAQFGPETATAPTAAPVPVPADSAVPSTVESAPPPKDEKAKHRAASQRATAEDAPRIAELTRKWRDEQREVERLRAELEAAKKSTPAAPSTPASAEKPAAPSGFTEPEPTLEQFADQADPYAAWQRAVGRWDRKKEAFEDQQARAQQEQTTRATEAETALLTAHRERTAAFKASHPDWDSKLQAAIAVDPEVPPVLERAIMEDDNGPALLYHLLTHPSLFDEMRLVTAGVPLSPASVAIARRRLAALAVPVASTVSTASAARSILVPPPPNTVRTGPLTTSDPTAGASDSIAGHTKLYGPKARR